MVLSNTRFSKQQFEQEINRKFLFALISVFINLCSVSVFKQASIALSNMFSRNTHKSSSAMLICSGTFALHSNLMQLSLAISAYIPVIEFIRILSQYLIFGSLLSLSVTFLCTLWLSECHYYQA